MWNTAEESEFLVCANKINERSMARKQEVWGNVNRYHKASMEACVSSCLDAAVFGWIDPLSFLVVSYAFSDVIALELVDCTKDVVGVEPQPECLRSYMAVSSWNIVLPSGLTRIYSRAGTESGVILDSKATGTLIQDVWVNDSQRCVIYLPSNKKSHTRWLSWVSVWSTLKLKLRLTDCLTISTCEVTDDRYGVFPMSEQHLKRCPFRTHDINDALVETESDGRYYVGYPGTQRVRHNGIVYRVRWRSSRQLSWPITIDLPSHT